MTEYELNILKRKYHEGSLDLDEWNLLEEAISQGKIQLEELTSLYQLEKNISLMPGGNTPASVRVAVMELVKNEKKVIPLIIAPSREWWIRAIMTAAAMLTGILIGYIVPGRSTYHQSEVAQLHTEMESLKETVMLTLLQKESATDRLKAVSYTNDQDLTSNKVINALLTTLNEDNSINVRLASIEALQQFGTIPWVREQLVKSISRQSSPLVQVALAECMVALKVKTSVIELKKVIEKTETPEVIKLKLEGCIQQII